MGHLIILINHVEEVSYKEIVQIMNTAVQIVTKHATTIYAKPNNTAFSQSTEIGIKFAFI